MSSFMKTPARRTSCEGTMDLWRVLWAGGLLFISLLLASAAEADVSPVVINEIHYDPDVKTELVEFVELYNAGTADVDISGWYFSNGISFLFPDGTILPAGGYIVVAEDPYLAYQPTTIMDKYGVDSRLVYAPFTGKLSNEGERIILRDAAGGKVDEVDYQLGFPWPTVGDAVPENQPGTGRSIQLVNPSFDNDLAGSWRSAYPTPAAKNQDIYADNIPPHIRQVKHSPKQPKSNEIVTITAKVTDADSVAEVTLLYQIVYPGGYIPLGFPNYTTNPAYENQANWSSIAMHDDGLNGDEQAGDDIYAVQLPGTLQVHRRLVRYRIRIMDGTSRSLVVPYDDDPQPNFVYFVYNGVPPWRGAIRPGAGGSQGQVVEYSTEVLTSLPVYHLISRQSDVENCQWNSSYDNADYRFYGTLVYDGEVYDHIRYRVRGQYSTFRWGKNKWKFNFNRGHYFQLKDDYGNERKEKWNKMNVGTGACPWFKFPHPDGPWDRGTGGMLLNECMALRLYNMAGEPASKSQYFHFRVIDDASEAGPTQYDGDFWGMYFGFEHADGAFIDEHELPDGNIYKMDGPPYNRGKINQGPTQVADGSDVVSFVQEYKNAHNLSWWQDNVNLDWYYSYRAVSIAINNSDPRAEQNALYYHNPETNKWSIHPWDLDLSYEWGSHWVDSGYNYLYGALNYQQTQIDMKNRTRELLDLLFNADQAWQLVNEMASVISNSSSEPSFVEAEQAMWEHHPGMNYPGLWYEHNEFLTTRDWLGMIEYYKKFLSPVGFSDVTYGSFGVHALVNDAFDPDIPDMPTVTYTGSAGFPTNDLIFEAGPFKDPQGDNTFAAMKWRIAEVEPDSQYVPTPTPAPTSTPSDIIVLLEQESLNWQYFKGNNGEPSSPVDAWRKLNFNDSSWNKGQTSIGYGDLDDNTVLNDMRNNYSTIYLRHKFNVSDIDKIGTLILGAYVDDGCIVWINGTEVARLYVSDGFKSYNDFANNHEAEWEQVTLPVPYDYIVEGENIIAVHALNSSLDSSDFSIDVALATITNQDTEEPNNNNPPSDTFTYRGRLCKYEINAVWESEEITEFNNTIRIPASAVQPGHTYRVRCRMKDNTDRWSHWSAPVQFVAGEPLASGALNNLRITEVMYNPADADISTGELNVDNDEFEFIELKNIGDETLDLTNVSFTEGILFDFAGSNITSLAPRAFVLVVKNKAAFESRYDAGVSNKIAGEYSGKLANEGEKISLVDLWNGTIVQFEYSDGNGWPQSADGEGNSLVPLASAILDEPDGSLNDGGNWRASTNIGGSPSQDDP